MLFYLRNSLHQHFRGFYRNEIISCAETPQFTVFRLILQHIHHCRTAVRRRGTQIRFCRTMFWGVQQVEQFRQCSVLGIAACVLKNHLFQPCWAEHLVNSRSNVFFGKVQSVFRLFQCKKSVFHNFPL